MGAAEEKRQIRTVLSTKKFDRPKELPKVSKKMKKDMTPRHEGGVEFHIYHDKKSDHMVLPAVDFENLLTKLNRSEAQMENINQFASHYQKERKAVYNDLIFLWELAFHSKPSITHEIAKEFHVHLTDSSYRQNINDLPSLLKAYKKFIHFHDIDKNGYQKLYHAESEKLSALEKKHEQTIREKENEIEKLQKELESLRSSSILVSGVTFKQKTSDVSTKTSRKENKRPQTLLQIEDIPEIPQSLNEDDQKEMFDFEELIPPMKQEVLRHETEKPRMNEKPSKPKLDRIEVEDSLFVNVLKQQGYTVIQSTNPHHDAVVDVNGEKIPLCYIDYPVDKTENFDKMLQSVEKIFFLFNTSDNRNIGDGKITRWAILSGRNKNLKYSYTTLDELKNKGMLNQLL